MKYNNLKQSSRQDKVLFWTKIYVSAFFGFVMAYGIIYHSMKFINTKKVHKQELIIEAKKIEKLKSFEDFKKDLAFRESSGVWDTLNQYGYIGLYQFGRLALADVGVNIDSKVFESNPYLFPPAEQDKALKRLINKNKRYLRNYYNYVGTKVNGIYVTESGMLAAAHLVGAGAVKKYFTTGKVSEDGNGTKMTEYMKLFSGYEI